MKSSRLLPARLLGVCLLNLLVGVLAEAAPVTLISWGPADDMVTSTSDSQRMTMDGSTITFDPDTTPLTPDSGYGDRDIFGGVQVTEDLGLTEAWIFNNHASFADSNDVLDIRNIDTVPANGGRLTALLLWENDYYTVNPTATLDLGLKTLSYTGGYSPNTVMEAYFVVQFNDVAGQTSYMISPTSITSNRLAGNGGTHSIDATTSTWYRYAPGTSDFDDITTDASTQIAVPNITVVNATAVGLLIHVSGKVTSSSLSCYAFSVTADDWRPKAPFKALYNNDTGNVSIYEMPDGSGGSYGEDVFTDAKLERSIDEVVEEGVDAYFLSPGFTHVPLWDSDIVDPEDHVDWWKYAHPRIEVGGVDTDLTPVGFYMEAGGDVLATLVTHTQSLGVASFVSVRLNDHHNMEVIDARPGLWNTKNGASIATDLWRYEHPEYRIKRHALSTRPEYQYYPDPANGFAVTKIDAWTDYERGQELNLARRASVLNWGIPAVVDRMYDYVEEIITHYPEIDGIELDFLRLDVLFRDAVTTAERTTILEGFVEDVRDLLDATGRTLQKRYWLSARLAATDSKLDVNGLDLADLAAKGVDIFVVSSNVYSVTQGTDIASFRTTIPDSAIYWEMAHLSQSISEPIAPYDSYRRAATDEQLLTSAFMAHLRGVDGISLFNYAYYRAFDEEPPFDLIETFKDPAALAEEPQHYTWIKTIPLDTSAGLFEEREFVLDLAPPSMVGETAETWPDDGIIRLHTVVDIPSGHSGFELRLVTAAGTTLLSTTTVPTSEPFSAPYDVPPSDGDRVEAWTVPASVLNAEWGEPTPEFRFKVKNLSSTDEVDFKFIDLYFEP